MRKGRVVFGRTTPGGFAFSPDSSPVDTSCGWKCTGWRAHDVAGSDHNLGGEGGGGSVFSLYFIEGLLQTSKLRCFSSHPSWQMLSW